MRKEVCYMKLFDKSMVELKSRLEILAFLMLIMMVASLLGCSDSEKEKDVGELASSPEIELAPTAHDIVEEQLEKKGWHEGLDTENNRCIAIGRYFLEDVKNLSEAVRQDAFQKAYDDALVELALMKCSTIETDEMEFQALGNSEGGESTKVDSGFKTKKSTIKRFCAMSMLGLSVLMSAESVNRPEEYEVSVAVAHLEKLKSQMRSLFTEGESQSIGKPGKYSIDEWVESRNFISFHGGRTVVDKDGERWLVGIVTDDGGLEDFLLKKLDTGILSSCIGPYINELGPRGKKLTQEQFVYLKKAYALWTAAKLAEVHVTADQTSEVVGNEEKFIDNSSVKVTTGIKQENNRIRWFKKDVKSPFTGADVKVLIGAVRCKDIEAGEREWAKKFYEEKIKALKK